MAIRLDKAFGDGADVCATSGLSSRAAVQATLSPEVLRNALLRAQYGFVKDRRNDQHYAIPMQLSQVGKKLYWMMGVKRSSVPFEID